MKNISGQVLLILLEEGVQRYREGRVWHVGNRFHYDLSAGDIQACGKQQHNNLLDKRTVR